MSKFDSWLREPKLLRRNIGHSEKRGHAWIWLHKAILVWEQNRNLKLVVIHGKVLEVHIHTKLALDPGCLLNHGHSEHLFPKIGPSLHDLSVLELGDLEGSWCPLRLPLSIASVLFVILGHHPRQCDFQIAFEGLRMTTDLANV